MMKQYSVTVWKNPSDTPPLDQTHVTYDEQEAIKLAMRADKDGLRWDLRRRDISVGEWEKVYLVSQ